MGAGRRPETPETDKEDCVTYNTAHHTGFMFASVTFALTSWRAESQFWKPEFRLAPIY